MVCFVPMYAYVKKADTLRKRIEALECFLSVKHHQESQFYKKTKEHLARLRDS